MRLQFVFVLIAAAAAAAPAAGQTQVELSQQARGTLPAAALPPDVKQIPALTVATLPGSPATNDVVIVTDCESEATCASGGGALRKLLIWTGSAWKIVGDGGAGGAVNVEQLDSAVSTASTFDFSRDFALTESPSGEVNLGLNQGAVRYAHTFASGGDGASNTPWTYTSGNPWAAAMADGAQVVLFVPGTYKVSSCPAEIPTGTSLIGYNRQTTTLTFDCTAVQGRLEVTNATNASPIEITTSAHGLTSGDWVRIKGVPGNAAANGQWQVTVTDSTHYTLNGSSGNGDFVASGTGMTAGRIFPIAAVSDTAPVQVTTSAAHGLSTGDRVRITDLSGGAAFQVNNLWNVTVVDSDTVELDGSARLAGPLTGGFLWPVEAVSAVATKFDVRGVRLSGFKFTSFALGHFANVIWIKASESTFEELEGGGFGGFDPLKGDTIDGTSASVRITGNGPAGGTFALTLTGGGSKATGPYSTITMPTQGPVGITAISSPVGGRVVVTLASSAFSDGQILSIPATAETTAAGAAGVFATAKFGGTVAELVGSTGTGSGCSPCGSSAVSLSEINPAQVVKEISNQLNADGTFKRDYYAAAVGAELYLIERWRGATPTTFSVSSSIPHSTTAWAATGRGGNAFILVDGNSFSSRFSRIFAPGGYANLHGIVLRGINNQQSIRDFRMSAGNNGGWGLRLAARSNIQNIDVFNMTTESAYGAVEVASGVSASFRTIYMEGSNEWGVRVEDTAGIPGGTSFLHGVTVQNGLLLGNRSLILGRGKGVTAESVVATGECRIGPTCEDCSIRSSYTNGCTVESPLGWLDGSTPAGKAPLPRDRYGNRLATANGALLANSVTNYARDSEDLTSAAWNSNETTTLVTADNPFGETQSISRKSVTSPSAFQAVTIGRQDLTGLAPNQRYGVSYWARVLTPNATCALNGGAVGVNREVKLTSADGWARVTGTAVSDNAGALSILVRCELQESGLPDFSYDVWGFMVHDLVHDGALPPYVKTGSSTAAAERGLYLASGNITAPSSQASFAPGGSAIACGTYTVDESELTAAATSEDVTLFTLPARGKVTGVTVKHSESFGGGGVTSMTVSVGDSSSATFYTSAFSVSQAVADTAQQDVALFQSSTAAARDVVARFASSGANVSAATTGTVDVSACWVTLP